MSARLGTLQIAYRTPFQKIFQVDDLTKYHAAQLGGTVPQNLPYGLDVWAPNKVLNMEWDDENIAIRSLRPGAWETGLITLAGELTL
jgi:hypothetical protein